MSSDTREPWTNRRTEDYWTVVLSCQDMNKSLSQKIIDPVEEAESVEDTDSIDDLRLAESSLLLDIMTSISIFRYEVMIQCLNDGNISAH